MNVTTDSNQPSLECILHSGLGVVFAVAVAVMVFAPQVQTLVV